MGDGLYERPQNYYLTVAVSRAEREVHVEIGRYVRGRSCRQMSGKESNKNRLEKDGRTAVCIFKTSGRYLSRYNYG
jgi:hypothetical protein